MSPFTMAPRRLRDKFIFLGGAAPRRLHTARFKSAYVEHGQRSEPPRRLQDVLAFQRRAAHAAIAVGVDVDLAFARIAPRQYAGRAVDVAVRNSRW